MDTQKFFIYARKSTDDLARQIRSIPDQIAELHELAKRENLEIIAVLEEKLTAKIPGRPIFDAMLERIERGEASGILAWHPDRLARNSLDGGRIIYLVDIGKITALKFPTFIFEPTPSGKFMLSIMFGQSKYYVDNLSENIKRGQKQKLRNGIWPLLAPVGYLNDRKAHTIYPDPHRAPLIRKAFELYATGKYTIDRLAETINALGLVGRKGEFFSRSHYHRFLQHPIYCGIIRYSGETYEGAHEPIVTKALFDRVQNILTSRGRPTGPKLKPYLYRGLFRCGECGCFITTETQKGHDYLHCTKRVKKNCSQRYVRAEAIAGQITDYIGGMALPSDWADWMLAELEQSRRHDADTRKDAIAVVRQRIAETDDKLGCLMDAYLDKTLSLEEYRESKGSLIEAKQQLKEKMVAVETNGHNWFEPAIRFVKTTKQAAILIVDGNDASRRDFLRKHGSNLTIRDRHLSVVPREPWQLVVDQGSFAQHTAASVFAGAVTVCETRPRLPPEEEGGVELTRPLRAYRFSRPAHSTTLPLLRGRVSLSR